MKNSSSISTFLEMRSYLPANRAFILSLQAEFFARAYSLHNISNHVPMASC